MAKIGRNESCPCGSGTKYKKCCLNAKVKVIDHLVNREKVRTIQAQRPKRNHSAVMALIAAMAGLGR